MYRKNTSGQFVGFQLLLTASGAIGTGLTPAVRRCIDGTFAAGGGTVTEDTGTGGYKYAMAQADTNGNNISLWFTGTGAIPVAVNFVTTAGDPTDAVRFGLSSLPNAAAAAIGGLLTAPTTANVGLADLSRILGTALTETAGQIAGGFKKLFDVASPVFDLLSVKQTGDTYARLGAPAGASVSADIAAAKVDTAAIKVQTDKLTFTVANQIDANVLDWKSATAPAMTGDAFARLGAPAGASVSADVAAVKVDTAAVKVQTDKFVFTVANKVDANVLNINGDATAAANLAKTTKVIGRGTASGVPTTTSIPTSAMLPAGAAADQFKGRIITFDADTATTALRGQSTDITASSNAAAPVFTVTALTTAPASGDTFSVT
jgi:hypothetical protein